MNYIFCQMLNVKRSGFLIYLLQWKYTLFIKVDMYIFLGHWVDWCDEWMNAWEYSLDCMISTVLCTVHTLQTVFYAIMYRWLTIVVIEITVV